MTRLDGMVRTRDGDLVPDPASAPETHHTCRAGWIGEDWDGHPIPCPTCRPHIVPRQPRYPGDDRGGITTRTPTPTPPHRRGRRKPRQSGSTDGGTR